MKNNLLKQFEAGKNKVELYVPSTIHDEPCNNSEQVAKVVDAFCGLFGGASVTTVKGAWTECDAITKKQITIYEQCEDVFSFCNDERLEAGLEAVIEIAKNLKAEMKQTAITLIINNIFYLI